MMSGKPRVSIVRVRLLRRCRGGRRLHADSQWLAPGFQRSKLVRAAHCTVLCRCVFLCQLHNLRTY